MEKAPIPQRQIESLMPGPNMEQLPPQPGPELMNLVMSDVQVEPVRETPERRQPLGLGLTKPAQGNKVTEKSINNIPDYDTGDSFGDYVRAYVRNDPRAQGGKKFAAPTSRGSIHVARWEHTESAPQMPPAGRQPLGLEYAQTSNSQTNREEP